MDIPLPEAADNTLRRIVPPSPKRSREHARIAAALSFLLHALAITSLFLLAHGGPVPPAEPERPVEMVFVAPPTEPVPAPAPDITAPTPIEPAPQAPPEAAPAPEPPPAPEPLPPPEMSAPPLPEPATVPPPLPPPPPRAPAAHAPAVPPPPPRPRPKVAVPREEPAAPAPPSPATAPRAAPGRLVPPSALAEQQAVQPVYPDSARRRREQGEVLIRVDVGADGRPIAVSIAHSSGFPSLDDAAATAVRNWHFRPATRDGNPVAASAEVPIRFRLTN